MKPGPVFISKPVLRQREVERKHYLQQVKIQSMQGYLETHSSQPWIHQFNHSKQERLREDSAHQIRYENQILLKKLNRVATRGSRECTGKHTFVFDDRKTTLNVLNRKLRHEEIQYSNLQILQKIQTSKPSFRICSAAKYTQIEGSCKKYKAHHCNASNITTCGTKTIRPKSCTRANIFRPGSNCRNVNINVSERPTSNLVRPRPKSTKIKVRPRSTMPKIENTLVSDYGDLGNSEEKPPKLKSKKKRKPSAKDQDRPSKSFQHIKGYIPMWMRSDTSLELFKTPKRNRHGVTLEFEVF
jgi:hypothetical protein